MQHKRHTPVPVGDKARVGGKKGYTVYPGITSILLFFAGDPFASLFRKLALAAQLQKGKDTPEEHAELHLVVIKQRKNKFNTGMNEHKCL